MPLVEGPSPKQAAAQSGIAKPLRERVALLVISGKEISQSVILRLSDSRSESVCDDLNEVAVNLDCCLKRGHWERPQ